MIRQLRHYSMKLIHDRTWYSSDITTSQKSKFIAHATKLNVTDTQDTIDTMIQELVQSDKSIQKSTHPAINAWMVKLPSGVTQQGMSDCGESGAGIKLMYLLQKSAKIDSGILVTVTRWYGGTPLGSSRFRLICNVAMEAIREGGLLKTTDSSSSSSSGKKKGKKKMKGNI